MLLQKIDTSHRYYPFAERLWTESFPEEERRDRDAQRNNVDHNPMFSCYIASENDIPVGLFTYWDFGDFGYCEHFATDPNMRGMGIGSKILSAVLSNTAKPLILEVELPENEMSRRRIGFYERCGLILWRNCRYVQPPYRAGGEAVPMMLMSTAGLNASSDMQRVVSALRRHVYCITENNA